MQPVCSVEQMRSIDTKAVSGDIAIGYELMKKAARGLCDAVKAVVLDKSVENIAILCGKGNNGGDGYTAGWMLRDDGYLVVCYSACKEEDLTGEARMAYDEYRKIGGAVVEVTEIEAVPDLSKYSVLVDALLGIGINGNPRGIYADLINAVNHAGVPVIAADTPSGLDNNNGVPSTPCVKATKTVVMGFAKTGMYFYPGRAYVGQLAVQSLGYNKSIVEEQLIKMYSPEISDLQMLLPPRHPDGSKNDHGLALLICGSRGMSGSATLVARAALRSGCGMTHLIVPESLLDTMSVKLTETVIYPVNETKLGTLELTAREQIKVIANGKHALCIGPGLGHDLSTSKLVRTIVKSIELPVVLDADGLNAFKGYADELSEHCAEMVITPHRGEWNRLFGPLESEPLRMIAQIQAVAEKYKLTILFKGNPTVVAHHDGSVYILPFGNSALAKAGSGDVLSGCIVSLIAQGAVVRDAAILGAYLQGEAGCIASRELSEYSVLASDVVEAIPKVIVQLINKFSEREKKQAESTACFMI